MDETQTAQQRERLRALLEAYGGDRSRWPSRAAPEMEALLRGDHAAREMLAEARRLDRALDLAAAAPDAGASTAKLAERIVAAAVAERARAGVTAGGGADAEHRVIAWPGPAGRATPSAAPPSRPAYGRWRIAGMLAASLALGVFAGARDILPAQPVVSAIEAGFARGGQPAIAQVPADPLSIFEEDLL